jgi:hypothetical protein
MRVNAEFRRCSGVRASGRRRWAAPCVRRAYRHRGVCVRGAARAVIVLAALGALLAATPTPFAARPCLPTRETCNLGPTCTSARKLSARSCLPGRAFGARKVVVTSERGRTRTRTAAGSTSTTWMTGWPVTHESGHQGNGSSSPKPGEEQQSGETRTGGMCPGTLEGTVTPKGLTGQWRRQC